MIILKGYCGGLTFRANGGNAYLFEVCEDGIFSLINYPESNYILAPQSSPAINAGVNQPNLIAVVAYHDLFYFYANRQLIAHTQNNVYKDGRIGVDNVSRYSDVAYSDLKVWTW
jgi:hypothetical protein